MPDGRRDVSHRPPDEPSDPAVTGRHHLGTEHLIPPTYRIAVIPGDRIGKEVVPEGLRVLDAAARRFNPACTGTIGIAPSANINPERTFPSLFEPVHGSAPDIAEGYREPGSGRSGADR